MFFLLTQILLITLGTEEHFVRSRPIRTVYLGSETLSCLGPKIWELIPESFKTLESVASFKTEIKKWKPDSCPCRLRKNYIHQVGFV